MKNSDRAMQSREKKKGRGEQILARHTGRAGGKNYGFEIYTFLLIVSKV
jgi:hypothetical protein